MSYILTHFICTVEMSYSRGACGALRGDGESNEYVYESLVEGGGLWSGVIGETGSSEMISICD